MNEYLQLIGLTLLGGIVSLFGGALLLSNKKSAENLAKYATPFAAGALLAAVFLDLLKEGIETTDADTVLMAALIGMLAFFLLERFLRWFHHHHTHEDEKAGAERSLIIVGDTAHNVLDGVAIAAAFLVSPATGLVTAVAVAAHEIPQEIADFGLLLNRGMSRKKTLLVNALSALATTASAIFVFALGSADVLNIGVMLGLSAGFLLYIAASDIIPEIHEKTSKNKLIDWPSMLLLAGVLVVGLTTSIAHQYIETGHSHEDNSSANEIDRHSEDEDHNYSQKEKIQEACQRAKEDPYNSDNPSDQMRGISFDEAVCIGQIEP